MLYNIRIEVCIATNRGEEVKKAKKLTRSNVTMMVYDHWTCKPLDLCACNGCLGWSNIHLPATV